MAETYEVKHQKVSYNFNERDRLLMIGCETKKSADEMMALVKFICKTANEIEEVLNETANAIAKFDVNLRWVWICINVSPVKSFSKLKIT